MDGSFTGKKLIDSSRFKKAFEKLPVAEDTMTFFDMQSLVKSLRGTAEMVINLAMAPRDVYMQPGMHAELNGLNADAMTAYQEGDIKKALALTKKAYEEKPDNTLIQYHLACFNALCNNKEEALKWLHVAIDGGFYAPTRIANDSDLVSLREDPLFKSALAKATKFALMENPTDTAMNFDFNNEAYRLRMEVHQTYTTKDYERGLKLIKQAYAIAPNDSKVVYTLACLHTLLGHQKEGLDFLDESVAKGFYCPKHISKDPDLDSVRENERFKAIKSRARKLASAHAVTAKDETLAMIDTIIDRIAKAMGVMDYSVSVGFTEGYSTYIETITELVADAKERPIYGVFGNKSQMTNFDTYLPKETVAYSISTGIDLTELYKFVTDTVGMAGAQGKMALARWSDIQKQIGLNIQKDLLDWLDTESIQISLSNAESVFMVKVKDEKAASEMVSAAIELCTTKLNELIQEHREAAVFAMLGLRTSITKHEQLEGFRNIHITMAPKPAVCGVKDGYLIIGSSADAVALCLATATGDHPGIRNNDLMMKEAILPTGPFSSVSLSDKSRLGEDIANGLGGASMAIGMMSAFIPEPEARPFLGKISSLLAKLTPAIRKINFYKTAASCTTFDGQTWRVKSVTHYLSPEERKAKDM